MWNPEESFPCGDTTEQAIIRSKKLKLQKRVKRQPKTIITPVQKTFENGSEGEELVNAFSLQRKGRIILIQKNVNVHTQQLILADSLKKAASIFDLNRKKSSSIPLVQGDYCLKCYHAKREKDSEEDTDTQWRRRVIEDMRRIVDKDLFENNISMERAYIDLSYQINSIQLAKLQSKNQRSNATLTQTSADQSSTFID
ncbi:uncharacterized protein LOC134841171 [Symsagittifera roscoffensis]|uniref:uncharacterized protein LOC134841171 n=1 Tax=Symsagittifera roscoffensis TaxID=84072 RepID=UPI00307B9F50